MPQRDAETPRAVTMDSGYAPVNRGGRPREREEAKRAAVTIRTTPTVKDQLVAAAEASGRSLTQEIELRLEASLARDAIAGSPETERLLSAYAAEIAQVEGVLKKRWHKDLKTWGAVSELLKAGPINRMQPDRTYDDEIVGEAWQRLEAVCDQKRPIVQLFAAAGIACDVKAPSLRQPVQRGLFGRGLVPTPNRWMESAAIENLDASEDEKAMLRTALQELIRLDAAEEEADKVYGEAIKPYIEAEQEGRNWLRAHRRQRAFDAITRGNYDEYDPRDLIG